MGVSKFVYHGVTKFDISEDTVTAEHLESGYTAHGADGEPIEGTLTVGGDVDYTRTEVCPSTTFSVASAGGYTALTNSGRLVDGANYIITFDNTEYTCTAEELYGTDRFIGDLPLSWGSTSSDYIFPFCVEDWNGNNEPVVYARDTSSHTIKIERLDLLTSGVSLVQKSVTANGTYDPDDDNADGYSEVVVNVSGGGGTAPDPDLPVKFVDYDGTLLYSYSAADLQGLSALPANPSHTGLTAQGWNYTLAQAKAQVTAMGEAVIGQNYVTSDDKTRLYCHFDKGKLSPYLGICPNGTVTVDWGDNTSTSTLTGTSETTQKTAQHTYAEPGDYVITLTAATGTTYAFYGTSGSYSYILRSGTTSSASKNPSQVYRGAIKKIELGSAAKIGEYAFFYCYSLETVTIPSGLTSLGTDSFRYCYKLGCIVIPNTVTSLGNYIFHSCGGLSCLSIPSGVTTIGTYAFQYCYILNCIVLPSGLTSMGQNDFYNCYRLRKIVIPSGVTSVPSNIFYACYSLNEVIIPSSVTSIAASAFYACTGVSEYHMKSNTPPTLSSTNAFSDIQSNCIIYVPYSEDHSVLSSYQGASNWSTYASYMQEESA